MKLSTTVWCMLCTVLIALVVAGILIPRALNYLFDEEYAPSKDDLFCERLFESKLGEKPLNSTINPIGECLYKIYPQQSGWLMGEQLWQ